MLLCKNFEKKKFQKCEELEKSEKEVKKLFKNMKKILKTVEASKSCVMTSSSPEDSQKFIRRKGETRCGLRVVAVRSGS